MFKCLPESCEWERLALWMSDSLPPRPLSLVTVSPEVCEWLSSPWTETTVPGWKHEPNEILVTGTKYSLINTGDILTSSLLVLTIDDVRYEDGYGDILLNSLILILRKCILNTKTKNNINKQTLIVELSSALWFWRFCKSGRCSFSNRGWLTPDRGVEWVISLRSGIPGNMSERPGEDSRSLDTFWKMKR